MNKLSMCRICLVKDVKMYSLISVNLQELYEKMTKIPFVTEDGKPVQVCYLCHARLQNCHRLQISCVKSEEVFNKIIADNEFNETELQDLNTLGTVHPLTFTSYVPSTREDPEDDKIDEDNDFKFDPLEITSDVQVKLEHLEDDSFLNAAADIKLEGTVTNEVNSIEDDDALDNSHSMEDTELEHDISLTVNKIVPERIYLDQFKVDDSFTNKEVYIKSECTVEDEDISTEDSVMSDNRHTMQNTELEHDIHLNTVKIVLERIDLEQFKSSRFAAKKPKLGLEIGNTGSTVSTQPQTEVTVAQINNIEKDIQTMASPAIVRNKNIVKQKSFIKKISKKKENIVLSSSSSKVYRCVVCEKSLSSKDGLRRHSRMHTDEKPYSCEICERSFSVKSTLVIHARIHIDEKPYKCDICEQSFRYKYSLNYHALIHTGEKPYRCNICEQNFTRKSGLVRHTRIHTGERPFKCNMCAQNFTQKSHLNCHTRIHTGERPYRCNICEQSFSYKRSLVNHTRIHRGEKPYRCNICGKKFNQRNTLVRHSRSIHNAVRSFSCDICKKTFSNKGYLVSHMLSHSAVRPYTCDRCQKSFSRRSNLIKHIHLKSH